MKSENIALIAAGLLVILLSLGFAAVYPGLKLVVYLIPLLIGLLLAATGYINEYTDKLFPPKK